MPHAMNDGIRIHYEVEGSGPPLLLQHGFFWSLGGWERWGYVDALKPYFQLLLVDARGHGKSDKPHDFEAYALSHHVADLLAVLDAEGVPSAHYWGFSMGVWIGFQLAITAPERTKALVLGGAHPYGRKLPDSNRPDGSDPRLFLETFFQRQGLDRGTMEPAKLQEFLDNDFQALAASQQDRPSLKDRLTALKNPVLLYAGEADGILAQVKECGADLQSAEFVALPGLNHPESFYRSDLVLPHAISFLRAQPRD